MKKLGVLFLAVILFASLTVSGCSSAQKKLSEEVKGIKTKVDTLETRVEGVEAKQSETERLAMEQAQKVEEMKSEKGRPMEKTNFGIRQKRTPKDRERVKEIQSCLKNAGFYHGEIDGVKGRKTRSAIKKFQKANGLSADGSVGSKTWGLLSKYSAGAAGTATPQAPAAEEEAANTK